MAWLCVVGYALTTYYFSFLIKAQETHNRYPMSSDIGSSFESGRKKDLTYNRGELHAVFVCIESKGKILYCM